MWSVTDQAQLRLSEKHKTISTYTVKTNCKLNLEQCNIISITSRIDSICSRNITVTCIHRLWNQKFFTPNVNIYQFKIIWRLDICSCIRDLINIRRFNRILTSMCLSRNNIEFVVYCHNSLNKAYRRKSLTKLSVKPGETGENSSNLFVYGLSNIVKNEYIRVGLMSSENYNLIFK